MNFWKEPDTPSRHSSAPPPPDMKCELLGAFKSLSFFFFFQTKASCFFPMKCELLGAFKSLSFFFFFFQTKASCFFPRKLEVIYLTMSILSCQNAEAAFWKLHFLWRNPNNSISTKIRLFDTTCVTILLYDCESWVIPKAMEDKISAWCFLLRNSAEHQED